jgi:flagellin
MALSVVNNIVAFQAQQSLAQTTSKLQKSLSNLSTGLRINSAADDPSGLAISERFRTQIRGLSRATSNAMDAQSMLQTAEGSLSETHNILQRMRELAVQSANGVLTSSDRQELQREMDQLKEEIDRIATSTEFNTKKLLDGSASALWSSDNTDITAIITGRVAEGNYKLVKDAEPVDNHVLKTDIFKVKDGAISQIEDGSPHQFRFNLGGVDGNLTDATTTGNLNLVFSFDGGATTFSVSVNTGSGTTAGFTDAEVLARAINADSDISEHVEAELVNGGDIIIRAKDVGAETDLYQLEMTVTGGGSTTNWAGEMHDWAGTNIATDSAIMNGGVAFTGFDTLTVQGGTAGTLGDDRQLTSDNETVDKVYNAQGLSAGDYDVVTVAGDAARNLDLETDSGFLMGAFRTSESTGEITAISNEALTENAYVIVEVVGAGGDGAVDFKVSWDEGSTWTNYFDYTSATDLIQKTTGDATNQFDMTFTGSFEVGDKFLLGMQNAITDENAAVRLTGSNNDWTNVSDSDGDWDAREGLAGADYSTFNHGLWEDLSQNPENTTGTVTFARMDEEGRIEFGSMDVDFGATFDTRSTNVRVLGSGDVAGPDTLLSKVDRFYDSDGNFVLGDSGKWISLYTGDGSSASFYVDGGDTIQELADKMEQIISLDTTDQGWTGLGLGQVLDSASVNHVTDYVMNATENSDEAVEGTIVIRSPKQGVGGYLYFSAEEDVLKALSLATIQDPAEDADPLTVTVYDAHTGELVGADTVSDNVLHGVISGVDVKVDSNVDIDSSWNANTRQIDFFSAEGSEVEYLHLVSSTIDFQIGANPGQTMNAYISQMDTEALGVQNALVVSQETAYDAMDAIDGAIQTVSSERARIGAYINRLDYTLSNLAVQEENQIAAESTIRDLDMASAISEMTTYQILQQVGVAMLGQANTLPQTLLGLLS